MQRRKLPRVASDGAFRTTILMESKMYDDLKRAAPLPFVRDPRGTSRGCVMTRADLPKKGERGRWTMAYKAIVAEAIKHNVISMEEACERYITTAREVKRWIAVLEADGMRALKADNFQNFVQEDADLPTVINDGPLSINLQTKTVRLHDQVIHMQPLEMKVLALLIRCAPHTVSRAQLFTLLYGNRERPAHAKILDVAVCKARRNLGCKAAIETVWGRGWRWKGMA